MDCWFTGVTSFVNSQTGVAAPSKDYFMNIGSPFFNLVISVHFAYTA